MYPAARNRSTISFSWSRSISSPIIGGRIGAHVTDNLGALNVQLPQEVLDRLDEVSGYEIGFPQEMIRVCDVWVYNGQFNNIEMEVPKWYGMKRTRTSIGDFVD